MNKLLIIRLNLNIIRFFKVSASIYCEIDNKSNLVPANMSEIISYLTPWSDYTGKIWSVAVLT
jgi:hypothetical protein